MSLLPDGRRIDGLKVTELKKELEIRGLTRSGAKKDLVARLSDHLTADENAPSAETVEHSEVETPHKQDNIIESDEEDANVSTATVIFVPKESPIADASVPKGPAMPVDQHVKIAVADGPTMSLSILESSMSITEPEQVLDSSTATDTELTGTGIRSQKLTSPSSTAVSSETKIGEAEPQSRRRNLWGARSDASSAGQAEKKPNSLVSFSTDTLEKMVPTLTVVDRKSLSVDFVPPVSNVNPASDVSTPVMTSELESSTVTADPPQPSTALSTEEHGVVTLDSSVEFSKESSGVHPLSGNIGVDEEVVVMDATVEGGLDIEALAVESHKPVTGEEVMMDGDDDDRHISVRHRDTRRVTEKRSIEAAGGERKQSPTKRKGLKETKAVGYLIEQPERVEPFQVTTRQPCEFVHITCLVRPFTATQLKQMITTAYGQVVDLWLNRIKSASVVQFESKEAAISCREGLDGSRWPSINPRVLRCDFVNQEFFNWMKQYGDMSDMNPPKNLLSGTSPVPTDLAKETKKADDDRMGTGTATSGHGRKSDDLRQKLSRRDVEAAPNERSKPGDVSGLGGSKAKSEPSKMLDDLFRKTTTSPCIYWLPLTDEEAQQRAVERADLAAKRGGTRATRSPFAVGGDAQRTDTVAAVDKAFDSSDKKKTGDDTVGSATSKNIRPVGDSASHQPISEKVPTEGKPSDRRGSGDQKDQRRDGSPFMASEKKSDLAGRPLYKAGGVLRDGLSGARRQRSDSSSSPSPKRPSKRPRPYREVSPRRRPGVVDYSRRRSSRSRSHSGGRYRGRMDSSADVYRRRRESSSYAHRSRR